MRLMEFFVGKVIQAANRLQNQLITSAIATHIFPKYVFMFVSTFLQKKIMCKNFSCRGIRVWVRFDIMILEIV